jgi:hypothetical protein
MNSSETQKMWVMKSRLGEGGPEGRMREWPFVSSEKYFPHPPLSQEERKNT